MTSSHERLPKAVAAIQGGIAAGLHLGAQLYVSKGQEVIADLAIGEARLGVPMRTDSVMLWLSSSKPVTAVAIGQLWEQGRLDLDQTAATFVPEFGAHGKQNITIRHLLTHTCGIRTGDKCDLGMEWSEILECICNAPIEAHWVPGKKAAYHPSAGWYVLGEIVRRVDGRPLEHYAKEEVYGRLGMRDCWMALPAFEFRRYGDRLSLMYHAEHGPASPHRKWNTEQDAAVCRPGRNGRGPVRELGRFYEALLRLKSGRDEGAAGGLLKPATVEALTTRQRIGMFDDTFQQVLDWGLGFAIDSKRYGRERVPYGFGRYASDASFGHGGSQSSCGFADPESQVVVAWAFNGLPGERRHQLRAHELNSAIYEDLGLDGR